MGEQIPVTQARAELAELVNRVAYAGERIELTRHGKVVAALVNAADLTRLQDPGPVRALGFAPTADPARPAPSTALAARPAPSTALPVAAESRPQQSPATPGLNPQV